ncbi:uncharacterized protein LOC108087737 [Drosophila ficusphila]|uniref:uncharacterized protein LOC108087737 n=1 Tax=Drosophila ficusphila TaxID=30025 RepID=UPI0007E6A028|nr:uncharacterized protein LOC108087737 [Drosophila ficusphila]
MLTSARQWEWEWLPLMIRMWLLWLPPLLLLQLVVPPGQVLLGDAASVTWGHVGKYASLLYTEDVYLKPGSPGGDLIYGSQNASDNYRITGIHVEDLSDGLAEAIVTEGGIGQEFVVIHCRRLQRKNESETENSEPETAHLEVSIYGVDI